MANPVYQRLNGLLRQNHGTLAVGAALEETLPSIDVHHIEALQILEGESPNEVYAVTSPEAPPHSEFTHFVDGVQRTILHGTIQGSIPVYLSLSAAVVLSVEGRRFGVYSHIMDEHILLLQRHATLLQLADDEDIASVEDASWDDEDGDASDVLTNFARIGNRMRDWTSSQRRIREHQLIADWCARSAGGWLYVDGTLSGIADYSGSPGGLVGVAKSHQTKIRQVNYNRVYGLRSGERSCAFLLQTDGNAPRYSWYLRLREGATPMTGLIRVETAPHLYAHTLGCSPSEAIAEISRWVMAESQPPPLADARWDRMVWGIYECEAYLKARLPSMAPYVRS